MWEFPAQDRSSGSVGVTRTRARYQRSESLNGGCSDLRLGNKTRPPFTFAGHDGCLRRGCASSDAEASMKQAPAFHPAPAGDFAAGNVAVAQRFLMNTHYFYFWRGLSLGGRVVYKARYGQWYTARHRCRGGGAAVRRVPGFAGQGSDRPFLFFGT